MGLDDGHATVGGHATAGADGAGGVDGPQTFLPLMPALERSVNYRLRMAQILAWRSFEQRMPEHGGAARYLGLLSIIARNPDQPQHRLAESIGLSRSSLVPILDRMETQGLVERHDAPDDRRAKAVRLTDAGAAVVEDLTDRALDLETQTLDGLAPDEVDTLVDLLDRLIGNLRRT